MFSNILPRYYFGDDVFDLEKQKIFSNNWIFICHRDDLANHNDFVTKKVGNIPVVLQNINGSIKAFMNVCSHRFSILQTQEKGNRALFCPYHGWSFNNEGKPTGIPKKPLFKDFNEQELCDLKLKEYRLESCGNFYFVHINEPLVTLKEYLGDFYEDLQNISNGISKLIDVNRLSIKANWKVLVENTLESYHVNLVHSDTFRKLGAKGLDFKFSKDHSKWNADLNLNEDDPKLSKLHSNYANRAYKINGYTHYLIYPNLLISTSYGVSFNISTIFPTTPGESEFISYVYMSKAERDNALVEGYEQSLIEFNRQVFDEDKIICEEVQKGVIATDKRGVLSLEEERVHAFQETYMRQII